MSLIILYTNTYIHSMCVCVCVCVCVRALFPLSLSLGICVCMFPDNLKMHMLFKLEIHKLFNLEIHILVVYMCIKTMSVCCNHSVK